MKIYTNKQNEGSLVATAIWLLVIFAIYASFTGCASTYTVHDETQLESKHLSLFGTDIPEFIPIETKRYNLWFSAETDSANVTLYFIKNWHQENRISYQAMNVTYTKPDQSTGLTWSIPITIDANFQGLYIMKIKGWGLSQTYKHEYRFEVTE